MALCACGCGKDAGVYSRGTYIDGVWMKGQPRKFFGRHSLKTTHCLRGHLNIPENRYHGTRCCKLCGRIRDEERREKVIARIVANQKKNPEKHAKSVRDWAKSQSGRLSVRATKAMQLYGLTPEQYHDMLMDQEGKCKICRVEMTAESHKKTSIAVDHDHTCCPGARTCGKCVRGMLCSMCNFMLGSAKDDAKILEAAIAYLRDTSAQAKRLTAISKAVEYLHQSQDALPGTNPPDSMGASLGELDWAAEISRLIHNEGDSECQKPKNFRLEPKEPLAATASGSL